MPEAIRIGVVEDDCDCMHLIRTTLEEQPDMEIAFAAADAAAAITGAVQTDPHLVLMDLCLNGTQTAGAQTGRQIRLQTNAKVLLLSAYEDPQIVINASKTAFASGYLFKRNFEMLIQTIRNILNGPTPQEYLIQSAILNSLTAAELSVFYYMVYGDVQLRSSEKTINNQKTRVFQKLGLHSKRELLHVFGGWLPAYEQLSRLKEKEDF